MTPQRRARLANLAWVALVLAVAAGTFAPALESGFVWDDEPFIVANEPLRASGVLRRAFAAGDAFGTGVDNPYYRPVTTLSFAADLRLFGGNPVGYHATNLLLHLVVCALVFLLALRLTGARSAAGVAALLFAVHPAAAEPVAYVSARADLLCAAFLLAAVLLHLRAREGGSPRDRALAAGAFALALLAKVVALALLPLLVLWGFLSPAPRERRIRWLAPYALLAGAFFVARALVLEHSTWESGVPFVSRLAAAGPLLARYLGNTLWPFDLTVFYDVPLRTSWGDPVVLGAWALLLGCAGACLLLLLLRRAAVIALGAVWYFVALFPVSGVVDLLRPALLADRYLYIPLAGAALAVAGGFAAAREAVRRGPRPARSRVVAFVGFAAAVASCSAFAVTTARRLPAWHDHVPFWEAARRGAPESPYVLNALGWAYRRDRRFDEAERVLTRAVELQPDFPDPRRNLAAVALHQGDFEAAGRHTEEVLRINPHDGVALRYRGYLLAMAGRLERAIASLESAVAAEPFNPGHRQCLEELMAARSGP